MNAAGFPILSLLTWLPLVGGAFIMTVRGDEAVVARNARWAALWTSLVVFLISLVLWARFDVTEAGFQFQESVAWLPDFKIGYRMGVDGISVLFVLLATALTPICILASWEAITTRVREYMLAFLVLETMMVGMFSAQDFVVFYMFFEGVLIPMFLIIGVWGGARRVYASFKFFLYTLTGSILMLLALLAVWYATETTDLAVLMQAQFPYKMQFWLFLAFFASFAVKVPMWPVHTWLPDAHVEAPTAGSVILAGVAAEDGGVRVPAVQPADAARGFGAVCAADVRARGDCGHLHVVGGVGADGHEEADRLFVGGAYGGRRYRNLHLQQPGYPGCAVPDVVARRGFGGVVPLRGGDLRPDAYPGDRAIRRVGEADAGLCGGVHAVHHGECRAAGDGGGSWESSWCWWVRSR